MELYKIGKESAEKIEKNPILLEKQLQNIVENNLELLFSAKLLATEHPTGDKHGGRIDTLGLDENNSPVIIEYKLKESVNVMNQALFYLDWLLDHKADFELLVIKKLGQGVKIDWSSPRVICVVGSFTKYDQYAISQIGRPIELVQYKSFRNDIILLDRVESGQGEPQKKQGKTRVNDREATIEDHVKRGSASTIPLFEEIREYITNLGDDVEEAVRKDYIAYRTLKNFCCLEIHKQNVLLYLKISPDQIDDPLRITRNVKNIGHFGTGNLEVRVDRSESIEEAKRLINASYQTV
ncbi:MAG: DUF5655 domain-containing protein [Actinomycetota bacterium]